eukprot:jgi/Bigna1/89222/estExt_fgenesh1_pg.C_450141
MRKYTHPCWVTPCGEIVDDTVSLMGRISSAIASQTVDRIKAEGSKVAEMITKGPMSLTAMCLLGGLLTTLSGFFGMLNILSPLDILPSVYNFVFGLLMIFLEVHHKIGYLGFLYRKIEYWMRILTTLTGRSLFYFYVGSLFLSRWTFFGILLGMYMCTCGVFSLAVGHATAKKLEESQTELTDMESGEKVEFIKKKFNEYDHDGSGVIDAVEMPSLLKGLGIELNEPEIESALLILDTNGTGKIEYDEFKSWLMGRDLNFV